MKILTVVSNFNEEREVSNCIADFTNNASIISDYLYIDNASTDNSINIIKKNNVFYLQHPANTGGGAGVIKTALLYAYFCDYDIYCHMDGDNQHKAEELHNIVQPILDGKADMVIGSRFINKTGFQSFFVRRIGIHLFSKIVSKITGYALTDITNGFRSYNRKAIRDFSTKYRVEYDVCVEMLLFAKQENLKVVEVPMTMRPRLTGTSEFNLFNSIKFPIVGGLAILGHVIKRLNLKSSVKCQ